MKDRIIQIMQNEGLSNAEFAEKIGISTSSLSHIYNGRNKPSLDVVLRIHNAYPLVNLDWLMTGQGEMQNSSDGSSENAENAQPLSMDFDFRIEFYVQTWFSFRSPRLQMSFSFYIKSTNYLKIEI